MNCFTFLSQNGTIINYAYKPVSLNNYMYLYLIKIERKYLMNSINKFINFLERKIGKYSIPNLPLCMIIMYALGYCMMLINPLVVELISFDPYMIIHKFQFWRLFSWLLIPPDNGNISILIIITLIFYYSISKNLERAWGTFYFNYYIFSGLIFTVIMGFLLYGGMAIFNPFGYSLSMYGLLIGKFASTYYICMSIFLAFAATYPDARVLMFFIVPIRVKILGYFYAIFMIYEIFYSWTAYKNLVFTLIQLFMFIASMLNFIIFLSAIRNARKAQVKFAKHFKKEVKKMAPQPGISKHKCCICGKTNDSNPELEFRFCSKCEGNYEYCNNHIFNHKHKSSGSVYY